MRAYIYKNKASFFVPVVILAIQTQFPAEIADWGV